MANEKNLKPFKKGEDHRRNIKGRPKKLPEIEALLSEVLGEDEKGKSAAKEILEALKRKAIKGDVKASELLLDRAYGKAKQSHEITGKDGEPIEQQITVNVVHSGAVPVSNEKDVEL